jgi:hypothetical protein
MLLKKMLHIIKRKSNYRENSQPNVGGYIGTSTSGGNINGLSNTMIGYGNFNATTDSNMID